MLPDRPNDENSAAQQEGEAPQLPSAVDATNSVDSKGVQTATSDELKTAEKEMSGFEKATLKWAKIAAGMSFAAALFICAQWWEMRRSAKDTHTLAQAAKTQAEKMGNMADAASKIQQAANNMVTQEQRIADISHRAIGESIKQNRVTLDSTISEFRSEHRAWVSLNEIDLFRSEPFQSEPKSTQPVEPNQIHIGDWILIDVRYKNTGSTPAFNIRAAALCDFSPSLPLPPVAARQSTGYGILQPGQEMFQSIQWHPVTAAQLSAVSASAVYVHGRIDYVDAFGVAHWATFCRLILSGGAQAQCPHQTDTTDKNPEVKAK
jgi:hypothetical protein